VKCPNCQHENPEDAKFCQECRNRLIAASEAGRTQSIPDAERKRVTALFSDLSGYTAMTEKLDPEEVKEITSSIFDGIRAVAAKYEGGGHKLAAGCTVEGDPREILAALVEETPGEEGKWFAAAKSAKLFDEAIELANRTPCSPQTLTRAARDFAEKNPTFAMEAGMAALRWLVEGYGYEITSVDVLNAYSFTMKAAENAGRTEQTRKRIRDLVEKESFGERFVTQVLGQKLEIT